MFINQPPDTFPYCFLFPVWVCPESHNPLYSFFFIVSIFYIFWALSLLKVSSQRILIILQVWKTDTTRSQEHLVLERKNYREIIWAQSVSLIILAAFFQMVSEPEDS